MGAELRWGERTYLMGIINVTPDSFSGDGLAPGGRGPDEIVAAALAQGRAMVDAGADILDVGAESTRPRQAYGEHPEISAEEEAALAIPVVRALAADLGDRAAISIDTSKGVVATAALEAGASIVNDVWAARRDPGTADAAAGVRRAPRPHAQPGRRGLSGRGVRDRGGLAAGGRRGGHGAWRGARPDSRGPRHRVRGKGTEENLELLHRLSALKVELGGLPVLVGTSRKRFLGELLGGAGPDDRVEGTAATVALAVASGADVVRVHDVATIARTLRVADAVVRR